MSAAATAAGYLYASGRLRGRGAREQEHAAEEQKKAQTPPREKPKLRKPVRVAVLPEENAAAAQPPQPQRPKRTPRIEYRVRRWRPDQGSDDPGHSSDE